MRLYEKDTYSNSRSKPCVILCLALSSLRFDGLSLICPCAFVLSLFVLALTYFLLLAKSPWYFFSDRIRICILHLLDRFGMALVPLHHFLPMGWAALIALCRFGRFGLLASLVTWQQGHCWESHPWIIRFFQLVLNSKSLLRMFWYNLGSSDETITVTWWWKINVETVGHEDTCIMLHAAGSCSPSSPLDPPKSPLNPIKSH